MRKTPGHNPRGLEKNSWNYRCLQIRHALGWSQYKLSRISGMDIRVIRQLEAGKQLRLHTQTIVKIKAVEAAYADIIKLYKAHPVRMDRLKGKRWTPGVKLLPIEPRRPEDMESVEKVGVDSTDFFFGRRTRRNLPNTGLSVRAKEYRRRRREKISRTKVAANAERRRKLSEDQGVKSGQSNDD